MSFGFSVGDVLAALTLAKDLTVALSETKGVAIELQQLKTMHDSIQKTVNDVVRMAEEWDRAHPNPSNKAFISALAEAHKTCKKYLDTFWEGSEKYMLSILNEQPKGSREKMKREVAKLRWYMFHSNDAAALERNLRTPVGAIKMHSELLRFQILKDIESSTSSTLTVVERNVNQTLLAMQGVDTRLQGFQSSLMNVFLQNPSAGLFLPDAPLILFDAIGRVLTVPAHLTGSFDIFHDYLELSFRERPGYAKIVQREYNLAEEDGEGTLITVDKWAELIKPGMKISLSMILRKSSAPERACPRCNTHCIGPELSGRRLRCQVCQVTFRMSDEERIVELPERPPPETPSRSSNGNTEAPPSSRQQKPKLSIPSNPLPRDEDLFQRVHIIREITKIKGGPQSENSKLQQMVAKAVEQGDVIGLKALLEAARQYDDDTYLTMAGRENLQLEVFHSLIAAGEDVCEIGHWGETPLHLAPDAQIARLLISHGADVHAINESRRTPLHEAKDEHIARLLISHGADVHAVDEYDDYTPLHVAKDEHIARLLISHGADVHAIDNRKQRTPLHAAKDEHIARLLISHGADVHAIDMWRQTPLHYANDEPIARLLISHGADVHAIGYLRRTPLHLAPDAQSARLLISHGADVHVIDEWRQTPLHYAKDEHIARLLISHGADVHAINSHDQTPLHLATSLGIAKVLIEHGADASAVDNSGQSPADLARLFSRPHELVSFLLENGAKETW